MESSVIFFPLVLALMEQASHVQGGLKFINNSTLAPTPYLAQTCSS
jgi:hypothetical protein